jgi:hypothetical protein
LGASVLLYRTLVMLTDGSMAILVPWVAATVVIEALMDGADMGRRRALVVESL